MKERIMDEAKKRIENGETISWAYLARKYKISFSLAKEIFDEIVAELQEIT